MFDGANLQSEVNVTFQESVQQDLVKKAVNFSRDILCGSCDGTREQPGSKSNICYSCQGKGVKKDPLFQKESRCNTCKGHGSLIQSACTTCAGTGLKSESTSHEFDIPRYVKDQEVLSFKDEGHMTLNKEKGVNGSLEVLVNVA